MDHLLRNRRLGSLATPVSNPFFIHIEVYFLHRMERLCASSGSSLKGCAEFFLNRGSEREEFQCWRISADRYGCAAIEVDLVPSIGHHVATMHVRCDGRLRRVLKRTEQQMKQIFDCLVAVVEQQREERGDPNWKAPLIGVEKNCGCYESQSAPIERCC